MDMQRRISRKVFELLSDLGEHLLVTEPFAQERFERGEERRGGCVASATSGQKASGKMRDFELLRTLRRRSEVNGSDQ
jgi:hypothetical protein